MGLEVLEGLRIGNAANASLAPPGFVTLLWYNCDFNRQPRKARGRVCGHPGLGGFEIPIRTGGWDNTQSRSSKAVA